MRLRKCCRLLGLSSPTSTPYAPEAQTAGYRELLADMENSLKAITGFDAISLQPNSGAQGEYSGMLAIRRYQEPKAKRTATSA